MNTKDYRLYGCHFTKEEYGFIKRKLKKLSNRNSETKITDTQVLLELFKLALKEEKEEKRQEI